MHHRHHAPCVLRQTRLGRARWIVVGALLGLSGLVQAGGPHSRVAFALGGGSRPDRGYLAVGGVPPLRWRERPTPVLAAEQPMITLYAAPQSLPVSGDTAARTPGGPEMPSGDVATDPNKPDPKDPTVVRPQDFLPFFQRGATPPAATDDGQRFVPANATVPPPSSAEYHLK